MTATLLPPTDDPRPPSPPPAPPPRGRTRPAPGSVGAELLLVVVTLVAVGSFDRLFDASRAVLPLLVAALAAHLVAAGARQAGWGLLRTLAASAAGLVLQASVVLYPHVSFLGVLPTGDTLTRAGRDLHRAWELFGDVVAPAPWSRGFVLASTVAIWVAVGLADWAAFRLRATAEAVLPAGALFVFTAILGAGRGGVVAATALAAAILGFAVAQRTRRAATEGAWIAGRARVGAASLLRVGGAAVLVAAVVAGVVAPRLPGADAPAVVDWRGGNGPTKRMTLSPLVDIRSRLVEQSDDPVFTVKAERSAYWRLTSLDQFDGTVWSSSESFSEADGTLPGTPPRAHTEPLTQTFDITGLDTIWAPAALTPTELVSSSTDLRWNGELATLIVPAAIEDIGDSRYSVLSQVPEFTVEDLDRPLPRDLPQALEDATRLPRDLPDEVADQARLIVADAGPTPYARARALQDWFRTQFTYDLTGSASGHDSSAILTFLRSRRGYCEQFAGTFAAMARTLGIPSRVAVGFTPGDVAEDGVTYTVRGRNAHAWPEVWIPGAGWVPFEPTPGRGQPGTEDYTGVAPAQDDQDDAPTTTTTTAPSPTTTPGGGTGNEDEQPLDAGPVAPTTTTPPSGGGGSRSTGATAVLVALVVLGTLVVADVALLAALRLRRRRRRRAAATVPSRVGAAWADAVEAVARTGVLPAAAETDREFARRAAPTLGPEAPSLVRLATLVTRTTWAPADARPDPDVAREADALARQVTQRARQELTWGQRLRGLVDPRLQLELRRR